MTSPAPPHDHLPPQHSPPHPPLTPTHHQIFESLHEIVKEGNFECTENGITFQGVDSSFVALVQLTLRKQGFEQFRCDESLNLGISIQNSLKFLKCGGAKDSLTLSSQEDSDLLSFIFEGPDRISKFEQKLMDIDSESLSIPSITYNNVCAMPSSEFQRIVRDLSTIGDTVQVTLNSEGVTFAVEGTNGSGSISLSANQDGEKEAVKIKAEEEFVQKFTLRYLNNFAKAASLSSHVSLKLAADQPLAVEYRMTIPTGEDDQHIVLGVLRFFLAPKSEDQEAE